MGKGKRNRTGRSVERKNSGPQAPIADFCPRSLTPAQRRAMKQEINRQVLMADKQYTDDFAAGVLWVLHVYFGFGHRRLRLFFEAYRAVHDHLKAKYELKDDKDTCFVCKRLLLDYGVDIAQWNKEEDKEMAKRRPRKLKRAEKIILTKEGIEPKGWLAVDDDPVKLHVVNEATGDEMRLERPTGKQKWE